MHNFYKLRSKREILLSNSRRFFSSQTIRVISGLASGNLFATFILILGSFIQARYVSPDDLGFLRSFSIYTGYIIFLQLGVFGAVQRLYPYHIGKGEHEKAISIVAIGQTWILAISAIVSSIFFFLALRALIKGDTRSMSGWLVQFIAIWSILYGGFLGTTYRSGHDFSTVAKGVVISSISSLFTLPLFLFQPFAALVFRSTTGNIVNLTFLHIRRPLKLRIQFTWKKWVSLIKEGLPIFIASYGASTGATVTESTIILKYLGSEALGFWSMGLMLLESANKIPQAISAVYIPRITETYGHTGNLRDCIKIIKKPMIYGVFGTLFLAITSNIFLPILVPILIPKYIDALSVMRIMMLFLPLTILELPHTILIALGKLLQQNIAVYIGLTSFIVISIIGLVFGFGLPWVAMAVFFSRTIRISFTYGFIFYNLKTNSKSTELES